MCLLCWGRTRYIDDEVLRCHGGRQNNKQKNEQTQIKTGNRSRKQMITNKSHLKCPFRQLFLPNLWFLSQFSKSRAFVATKMAAEICRSRERLLKMWQPSWIWFPSNNFRTVYPFDLKFFLVVALYERKVPFDDGCRWTSKMAAVAAILNLVSVK